MKFINIFILLEFFQFLAAENIAELEACNSKSSTNEICYTSEEYHSNEPHEVPMSIVASFDIREIVDINESKQTLTLLNNFIVTWSDKRIQITNNSWHSFIDTSDHIRSLWIPEMYFSNSVQIEKFKGLKADSMKQLWYYFDQMYPRWLFDTRWLFSLAEPFKTEFACKMNFQDFPFDRHTCMLEMRSTSWLVKIIPMLRIGPFQDDPNATLHLNSTGFPFDIKAYPMKTNADEKIPENNSAPSRIQFDLSRNTDQLKTLLISFYIPSMAFTLLSQVSYFIKPEVVPGRMGMLVTMFLIQTGIYGSVDSPKFRGFGFLEMWYIGMQVPILMAIMEYGFLLVAIKYKGQDSYVTLGNRKKSLEATMKRIDLFSFFSSFFSSTIFIVVYLAICIKEMNQ